ncbi:reverse transcriptase domain-containing protein [Tanacetum coccineum]
MLVEVKPYRSIDAKEVLSVIEMGTTWMDPIVEYLKDGKLPDDLVLARKIRIKSPQYSIKDGILYKKHILVYAGHILAQGRSLKKPQDYVTIGQRCIQQWGIDLVGPFPEAPSRVKFLVVAVDYFTKWVESKPLATVTAKNILKFVWKNNVCRFGIPGIIISDNGKQFVKNPFREWCQELYIQQKFTSVAHPQANGQT